MRQIGLLLFLILMVSACTASDDSLPTQLKLPAPTKTLIPTQAQALTTPTLPEDVNTSVPATEPVPSQQIDESDTGESQSVATQEPTPLPTDSDIEPTDVPTQEPTPLPTDTDVPTQEPTPLPTDMDIPTEEPTPLPTDTDVPTQEPKPSPTEVAVQPTAAQPECNVQDEWDEYTVQRGDNLANIASRTGSTIDELGVANCLENPNRLRVGQILYVPNSPENTEQDVDETVTSAQESSATDLPSVSVSIRKTFISEKGFAFEYPIDWNLLDLPSTTVTNTILTSFEYTLGDEIPQNRWTDDMVSVTITVFEDPTSDTLSIWTEEVMGQFEAASNITQVNEPEPFLTDNDVSGLQIEYISSDETLVSNIYFIVNNHKVQLSIGGNIDLALPVIQSLELTDS